MTDNRTTELESLSKLKKAGKLRYWRRAIEIPEDELHAICDEIQAEHDRAVAATLGAGECELVETESYSSANEVIHVLECSSCGETCEHVNGSYPRCPHCGRKAVK